MKTELMEARSEEQCLDAFQGGARFRADKWVASNRQHLPGCWRPRRIESQGTRRHAPTWPASRRSGVVSLPARLREASSRRDLIGARHASESTSRSPFVSSVVWSAAGPILPRGPAHAAAASRGTHCKSTRADRRRESWVALLVRCSVPLGDRSQKPRAFARPPSDRRRLPHLPRPRSRALRDRALGRTSCLPKAQATLESARNRREVPRHYETRSMDLQVSMAGLSWVQTRDARMLC